MNHTRIIETTVEEIFLYAVNRRENETSKD